MPDNICGSPSCLVDRLEKTLKAEMALSREFISTLVTSQVDSLKRDNAEIFARLRNAENRITVIETTDETNKKGRTWMQGIVGNIIATVISAAITASVIYFLFIYDTHGRPTEYPKQNQTTTQGGK